MVSQQKNINILLLGQTGVGKSTFINGFCNYLEHQDMQGVLDANKIRYCIPTIFTWSGNEDNYDIIIGENQDADEHQILGQSATQQVKSYLFHFNNISIRIIDTPGFGDTEGIEKDENICENLLNFLSVREELLELHAIIFLFKPNDNRLTVYFKYCLNQIFSKLHRSASENIIFVFTHAKGADYKPGTTLSLLKTTIAKFDLTIPCGKNNIFCVENDCIKYLLTHFYNTNQLQFDDNIVEINKTAWKKSSSEILRLVRYVMTLDPHCVEDTIAINKARNYITKLKTQLPIISVQIDQKINDCKEYEKLILAAGNDIDELKKVLYKSTITKRDGYQLICCNRNCKKKDTHGQNKKPCCANCRVIMRAFCDRVRWGSNCKECGCNDLDHVYKTKDTHTEVSQTRDENFATDIDNKQAIKNEKGLSLFEQRINVKKYEAEKKYINNRINIFLKYLNKTAIITDQRNEAEDPENCGDIIDTDLMSPNKIAKVLQDLSKLEMMGKDINCLLTGENISVPTDKIIWYEQVADDFKIFFESIQ